MDDVNATRRSSPCTMASLFAFARAIKPRTSLLEAIEFACRRLSHVLRDVSMGDASLDGIGLGGGWVGATKLQMAGWCSWLPCGVVAAGPARHELPIPTLYKASQLHGNERLPCHVSFNLIGCNFLIL